VIRIFFSIALGISLSSACPIDTLIHTWTSKTLIKRNLEVMAKACDAPGLATDSAVHSQMQFLTSFGGIWDTQGLELGNVRRRNGILEWIQSLNLDSTEKASDLNVDIANWQTQRQISDSLSSRVAPAILWVMGTLAGGMSFLVLPVAVMFENDKAASLAGLIFVGSVTSVIIAEWISRDQIGINLLSQALVQKALALHNRNVIRRYLLKTDRVPN
jgi:hypothetical protein